MICILLGVISLIKKLENTNNINILCIYVYIYIWKNVNIHENIIYIAKHTRKTNVQTYMHGRRSEKKYKI